MARPAWGAYKVRVALGGVKALSLLAGEELPDLCLLDVNMPAPDGLEVCRRSLWTSRNSSPRS
jgi:CheY-like chemotaxis protein